MATGLQSWTCGTCGRSYTFPAEYRERWNEIITHFAQHLPGCR